jgi:hypothetical protein
MTVYTPNLQLVQYTGETPRKLWEVKARKTPVLQKGDLVLLDNVVAVLMVKKYGFEMVDNSLLTLKGVTPYDFKDLDIQNEDIENFANENQDGETQTVETQAGDGADENLSNTENTGSTDEEEDFHLPKFEELESLDIESVKKALAYVGVKAGNRNIDTLKQILMPYLPKGE